MGRFDNKVAIVTGGARGIGAAVAREFVKEGGRVVIADILDVEGTAVAKDLGASGLFVPTDVTQETGWTALVARAEAVFGGVDALISHAGTTIIQTILNQQQREVEQVLAVNLMAAFIGTRIVAPAIAKRGGGSVVYTCSSVGKVPYNGFSAYAASKWGLRGFAKVAALELAPYGIRVNTVLPGVVNTPWTNPTGAEANLIDAYCTDQPIPRAGTDAEIAHAILFLVDEKSSYIVGSELVVDGGHTSARYNNNLPGLPGWISAGEP